MTPTIVPISFNQAKEYFSRTHRHLSAPNGWLFGCALIEGPGIVLGVACAARPSSRMLQDGRTCEIVRVATEGHPNACSQLYGALRRAAVALGYNRIYTYTRADEPGISPRAAGFVFDGEAGGGEWSRTRRPREQADDPSLKHRWVWPVTARKGSARDTVYP